MSNVVFIVEKPLMFGIKICLISKNKNTKFIFEVDGETDETMTYTDLVKRTEMAAAGLQRFGIAKGDVICVISQNQLDFVVAFYASALIGSIFQPIDPGYSAGNLNKSFLNICINGYLFFDGSHKTYCKPEH